MENIEAMRNIVENHQATEIDGVLVDMFTASAVTQIYDQVNDKNKAKMRKMDTMQLASIAYKILKKGK